MLMLQILDTTNVAAENPVTTQGLRQWIQDNGAMTILVVIACAVLGGALKGNLGKVVTIGGLAVVGLMFVALAASPDAASGVGSWALGLFGIHTQS